MLDNETLNQKLTSLEALLVQQFRTLESLVGIAEEERQQIIDKKTDDLIRTVEKKEAILDQLGLLEEDVRQLITEVGLHFGLASSSFGFEELTRKLEPALEQRFRRLNDGILILVKHARDLNYGNKALATASLQFTEAVQLFLLNSDQMEVAYDKPGVETRRQKAKTGIVDQRA